MCKFPKTLDHGRLHILLEEIITGWNFVKDHVCCCSDGDCVCMPPLPYLYIIIIIIIIPTLQKPPNPVARSCGSKYMPGTNRPVGPGIVSVPFIPSLLVRFRAFVP